MDCIWTSYFSGALDKNGYVFILELFWDRRCYEVAAFCLQPTPLYFTALANGIRQMYSVETFLTCVREAGFHIMNR